MHYFCHRLPVTSCMPAIPRMQGRVERGTDRFVVHGFQIKCLQTEPFFFFAILSLQSIGFDPSLAVGNKNFFYRK